LHLLDSSRREGSGKDVFVHVTAVQAAGFRGLNEGQRVQFDIEANKRAPRWSI
jgi:cold shock protein